MRSKKLIVLLMMMLIVMASAVTVFADHDDAAFVDRAADAVMTDEEMTAMGYTDAQKNAYNNNVQEAYSSGASPTTTQINNINNKAKNGYLTYEDSDPIAKKMKLSKKYYSFSIEESDSLFGGISPGEIVNAISNMLFGLAKAFTQFTANTVASAMNAELTQKINDFMVDPNGPFALITSLAGNVFSNTGKGINGLIWLGVTCTLAVVVVMFAQRRTAGALGKILGTILIMVLIGSYMIIPNFFMKGTQDFTTSVCSSLFGGNNNNSSPGDAVATKIWCMGVDQPWQELEFGKIMEPISDKKDGALTRGSKTNAWLCIPPEERTIDDMAKNFNSKDKSIYDNMDNSASVQAGRAGESLLILILDFVLDLLFLLLAVITLGFQIGGIIMWVVGFFVLIVALFPTHGVNKIKEWAGGVAMTYFGQIVVSIVLMLVTELVSIFYQLGSVLKTFGAVIGVVAAVLLMKGPIMRLFAGAGGALASVAPGGGVVNMGRNMRARSAYRGDSTERGIVANPIRQNREAKRMAQRDAKVQAYQEKMHRKKQNAIDRREGSVTRAVAHRTGDAVRNGVSKATAPVANTVRNAQRDKREFASDVRTRGAIKATASKVDEARLNASAARHEQAAERANMKADQAYARMSSGNSSPAEVRAWADARADARGHAADARMDRQRIENIRSKRASARSNSSPMRKK